MTVYVYSNGAVVPKHSVSRETPKRSSLPAPQVSRFETMQSPVTGKDITSWRERDADMKAADAVDRRDLPSDHRFKRGREAQQKEVQDAARRTADAAKFEWRDAPVEQSTRRGRKARNVPAGT